MADVAYKIKDWDVVFEDYRSRPLQRLNYLMLPLDRNSEAYAVLMQSKSGIFAYGMFCSLLAVAARCPVRGLLADDRGPLTAARLAIKLRSPARFITDAITILSGSDVGWLVKITDWASLMQRSSIDRASKSAQDEHPLTSDSKSVSGFVLSVSSSDRGESERGSPKPSDFAPPRNQLSGAWNNAELRRCVEAYPKKCKWGKVLAAVEAALARLTSRGMADAPAWLEARVKAYAAAVAGQPVQFIPDPHNWLDAEQYDDDPATWKREGDKAEGPTTAIGRGEF